MVVSDWTERHRPMSERQLEGNEAQHHPATPWMNRDAIGEKCGLNIVLKQLEKGRERPLHHLNELVLKREDIRGSSLAHPLL